MLGYVQTMLSNLRFLDIADEPQQMLLPIEGFEKMPLVSLEVAVEPLVCFLPDIHRKVYIAKQNSETPLGGLSSDESAAICLYSMEWEPYNECLYFVLNTTLREKRRQKLKPWFLYLRLVLTALNRLPSMHLTVYRGVKLDLHEEYPKGKIFVWWGFSSCTSSIDVLQSEQFLGNTGTRTMFTIDCYNGKDIGEHSYFNTENEILLPAATQFQVVACLDQGNGLHIIQLKEINPPFPLIQSLSTRPNSSNSSARKMSLPGYAVSPSLTRCETNHESKLKEQIAKYKPQTDIYLFGKNITERHMEIVVQQAIISKQCARLYLRESNVTAEGASILADALHNNTTLKGLFLFNNHVCDTGAQSLAEALSTNNNSTLQCLSLGWNSITDTGAQHLAEMLKTNRTLIELWLPWNPIGDRGVELLTDALAHHNTTLEVLSLGWNRLIGDSSVDYIIEMLKHNRSLKVVDVGSCKLSRSTKSRLREAAKSRKGFRLEI